MYSRLLQTPLPFGTFAIKCSKHGNTMGSLSEARLIEYQYLLLQMHSHRVLAILDSNNMQIQNVLLICSTLLSGCFEYIRDLRIIPPLFAIFIVIFCYYSLIKRSIINFGSVFEKLRHLEIFHFWAKKRE